MSRSRSIALASAILLVGLSSMAPARAASAEKPAELAQQALTRVQAWRHAHGSEVLKDFVELLSIPNVATDSPNIRRNAEAIRQRLAERGVATELWSLSEDVPPVVYGYLPVDGARRTLGVYVHYDGQPVDESQWTHPAWSPVLYTRALEDGGAQRPLPEPGMEIDPEWRLYGRSTGDDKAPLAAIFAALDALQANKVRHDGHERSGGEEAEARQARRPSGADRFMLLGDHGRGDGVCGDT